MTNLTKLTRKSPVKGSENVIYLHDADQFSLDNLSSNLTLSEERSKALSSLYKNNETLQKKSTKLVKELNEEKYMTHLQSEFVSLVSHEFRNPLSIIKATADVLKRLYKGNKNPDTLLNQINKIDKAVLRMNKLIESTLNLSRLESGKIEFTPTDFCLKELISEVVDRYTDVDSDVKFNLKINTKKKLFNGDRNLIDQILTNLITNSIKYSNKSPTILIKCNIETDYFAISVKDNGLGISEDDLKKLFIKYFRSKKTIGTAGTGIGLYLVKQFVALHHGKITVKSELSKGSEFIIYLPT